MVLKITDYMYYSSCARESIAQKMYTFFLNKQSELEKKAFFSGELHSLT